MQISVQLSKNTSFLDVDPAQTILSLKQTVSLACGVDVSSMMLLHNARALRDADTIAGCGIQSLGMLSVCPRVLGGGGNMSENDRALAMAARNHIKICRRCYARLAPAADKCRKPKCHNKDTRLKKLIKTLKK